MQHIKTKQRYLPTGGFVTSLLTNICVDRLGLPAHRFCKFGLYLYSCKAHGINPDCRTIVPSVSRVPFFSLCIYCVEFNILWILAGLCLNRRFKTEPTVGFGYKIGWYAWHLYLSIVLHSIYLMFCRSVSISKDCLCYLFVYVLISGLWGATTNYDSVKPEIMLKDVFW